MTAPAKRPGERSGARLLLEPALLALLVAATVLELALLATTVGSNDAYACFRFGVYALDHPLRDTYAFFGGELNHPPLGLGLMAGAIAAWRHLGLSAFFWLRVPALGGELLATVVTAELLATRTDARTARRLLGALIVSPLVFAELFHGNTDLLWVGLALAAALALERGRAGRSGALVALAIAVKLPALAAVAPLAVVAWREEKLRRFAAGFGVVALAVFGPALLVGGEPFARSVFGYRGTLTRQPWGVAWALGSVGAEGALELFRRAGGPLALGASAASALAFRRGGRAGDALAVALGVVLLLAPAFGVQYLAWLAAPVVLLGGRALAGYHATAGLQAILLYVSWGALRAPHFADSQTTLAEPSAAPAAATWIAIAAIVAHGLTFPLAPEEKGLEAVPCNACGGTRVSELLRLRRPDAHNANERVARCRACGLIFVSPRVPRAELERPYRDEREQEKYFRERYLSQEAALRANFRHLLALLETHAKPPARLRDLGCAVGLLADEARALGYEARGLELSTWAARYARERFGLEVSTDGLAALPEASEQVLTLVETIEHVPDPLGFLREARRVLAPGGVLMVTTPNWQCLERWRLGRRWDALAPDVHVTAFTRRTLRRHLERAGLDYVAGITRGCTVAPATWSHAWLEWVEDHGWGAQLVFFARRPHEP